MEVAVRSHALNCCGSSPFSPTHTIPVQTKPGKLAPPVRVSEGLGPVKIKWDGCSGCTYQVGVKKEGASAIVYNVTETVFELQES